MLNLQMEDLIFLDFEASGLGVSSWPIEIGLSWIEEGQVRTWSSLIRPLQSWSMEAWDPVAEPIHGIARETLTDAPPAHVVATQAAQLMAGKQVCSDAPGFEAYWAARLFEEDPEYPSFPISYAYSAMALICTSEQMDRLRRKLSELPAPHRAGPDAERLARALLYAVGPGEAGTPVAGKI